MVHFDGCRDVDYEYEETIATPKEEMKQVCVEFEELYKDKVRIVEKEEYKTAHKIIEQDTLCVEEV